MEAAVVAEPDERWGEMPHAFVLRTTFGPLPKTSTGRVQKHMLRQAWKQGEA